VVVGVRFDVGSVVVFAHMVVCLVLFGAIGVWFVVVVRSGIICARSGRWPICGLCGEGCGFEVLCGIGRWLFTRPPARAEIS